MGGHVINSSSLKVLSNDVAIMCKLIIFIIWMERHKFVNRDKAKTENVRTIGTLGQKISNCAFWTYI